MSRCFPFPPPGYERKNRPEDLDILKEAKRKEKKHKKEKKDKERKKEKEEKDGTDDKQRGKKDQKEKRKDKKEKHKDKKDKEEPSKDKKISISGESTVFAKLDEKCDERLHPKGLCKSKNSVVHEGKGLSLFQTPSQRSPPSKAIDESNFAQEFDRRVREDRGRGSQLPERTSTLHNSDQVHNSYKVVSEEKGNKKDCRVDYGKIDLDRLKNEFEGSTMVQNHIPLAESKIEDFPGSPKRQNDRTLEGKFKFKEPGESKGGDKHKKSHGKEKDTEKENKKEKVEVRSEEDMLKVIGRNDVGVNGRKHTDNLKNVNTSAEGNIRKRKDIDTNGFLHGIETRPNKIRRHASHESTENKRKLEFSQTTEKSSYDKSVVHNHIHVDSKDGLINGMTECHKPSPSKTNAFVPNMTTAHFSALVRDDISLNEMMIVPKAEGQTEASRRLPHPDSKYLSEILSVPIVGNWSENDDQEWLFSKKSRPDKPDVGLKELCVWSEALHIKSADICALPYVIPY